MQIDAHALRVSHTIGYISLHAGISPVPWHQRIRRRGQLGSAAHSHAAILLTNRAVVPFQLGTGKTVRSIQLQ